MFFKKRSYPLSYILTGFEHSGTTLVSEILRQVPEIDSGFEGGLLLCKQIAEFKEFEPFATNFKNAWKISEEDFEDICNSKGYGEAYEKIRKYSAAITDKSCRLFDKTPRYMQRLGDVLDKTPDVKAVVIVRDMRSIIDSTFRRSGQEIDEWMQNIYPLTVKHTRSYLDGLTAAQKKPKHARRIKVIRYEELILEQERVAREVFSHLKIKFKPQYLSFEKVKYRHVYGNNIQDQFISKYKRNLTEDIQAQILADFADYSEYFWES